MNFMQFVRIVWAQRLIVLVCVVGAALAAAIVIKIVPTRYETASRVLLEILKPDPVTGQSVAGPNVKAYVKTQAELISDYRVTGRVVDQLGWTSSPLYLAAYANRSKNDKRDFRRWVAQQVADNTDVRLLDGSNILEISYRSGSAESARLLADAVRQAYVDQTLAFKRDAATRAASWFRQQAELLKTKLTAAQERMNGFERANDVILTADDQATEEMRLKALAGMVPLAAAPVAPAQVATAAGPTPSQSALTALDAKIELVSEKLGPNHPELIVMRKQRELLVRAAAQEAAAQKVTVARTASGPSVESMFNAQQTKVLAKRGKINEAQKLATDVALLRDQYTKTAQRAAEYEQQALSTESGLTLLGSATAPGNPAYPNKPLIIAGGLGLGLMLGLLAAVLFELLFRRVRGIDDLYLLGAPVLGTITREPSLTPSRLLAQPVRLLRFEGSAA